MMSNTRTELLSVTFNCAVRKSKVGGRQISEAKAVRDADLFFGAGSHIGIDVLHLLKKGCPPVEFRVFKYLFKRYPTSEKPAAC
jgi:hypothetical protein